MATQVQFRRGSTAQVAAATPAAGEIVVDTDKDTVVVGDGSTAGGFEVARADGSNWAITNAISTTANISFGDNDKAIFGAGSDLQIYHDGSNSIITDQGSGTLKIQGDSAVRLESTAGERYFVGTNNGAARLYHDDSEKLATTSTGIDVTGTAVTDGLTVDGNVSVVSALPRIILEENDATDLNTAIRNNGGVFKIQTVNDAANSFTNRMDINHSSGNVILYGDVGIGATSATARLEVTGAFGYASGANSLGTTVSKAAARIRGSSDASTSLFFGSLTNDAEQYIQSSNGAGSAADDLALNPYGGNVGIGGSPASALSIYRASGVNAYIEVAGNNNTPGGTSMLFGQDGSNYGYCWNRANQAVLFGTNGTERMRIDSSGNLLAGKTTSGTANTGAELRNGSSNHAVIATSTSETPVVVNRKTNDGSLINLLKDGTTVGRIATWDGEIAIGRQNCALLFDDDTNRIKPHSVASNTVRDNALDMGGPSARFDDIYATNGTIRTSDRNEKQDIEALSDAEQRVAVAAKGLLRKFRWISSVQENGDDARIHFGIIAQDLQAAFEAEGLDAGRYAMFISNTWTDEKTGEERTRMGVRYSELLAFIISAI